MISYFYALVQNVESEEYHIRQLVKKYDEDEKKYKYYYVSKYLECGDEVDEKYTKELVYEERKFFAEDKMRYICYQLGRKVCGQCVATLYATK